MIAQLQAAILDMERIKRLFDFDKDHFGEDLLDIAAEQNRLTFETMHSPSGEAWEPLSPMYEKWKSKHFPGSHIGHLYELLSLPENFVGQRTITPTLAASCFGLSQEAEDEAHWFQDGDAAHNRPARPFFGLDSVGVDMIWERVLQQMNKV